MTSRGANAGANQEHPDSPAQNPAGVDTNIAWLFFVFGGVASVWLAYLLVQEGMTLGWGQLWFSLVYWIVLAYLVLPRLHRILTRIYVPGYFIGRARTSDGLLGDPINIALLGSEAQLHAVMRDAGWTRADDLSFSTGIRIVRSTLARRSYPAAPVSPLLLFDRQQDFAYQQQVAGTPGKRHHVRFWRCPDGWMLPGGIAARWLAAGTYDRSVGLSLFTLQVTHKINPDTDTERDHVVSSIQRADAAVAVTTIKDFSTGYHARNGGGDEIVTDGDLPIVDLREVPVAAAAASAPHRVPTDSRNRRPAPIIVGALFVAARGLFALYLMLSILLKWDIFKQEILSNDHTLSSIEADVGLRGFVILLAAFTVLELLLAWQVFLGRNWARTGAMSLSTLAIIVQAIAVLSGGPGITLQTNLPGLSLDILLIIALSSDRAVRYARRRHTIPRRTAGRPHITAAP